MRKIFKSLFSGTLALLIATLGIVQGFAAELPENCSTEVSTIVAESQTSNYPMITKFTPVKDGVKISWSKYSEAAKYRVYILYDGKWKNIGTTTSTSLVHKNPVYGTEYIYTVRALDTNNNYVSSYYKLGFENILYASPVIRTLSNTNDGVNIKWAKLNGVDNYRVYRKTGSTKWTSIGEVEGTSFIDENVTSGVSHTYTLRCLDTDGKLTSYYNQGKSVKYIEAPQITKLENTATGIKIRWTKSNGAEKYGVYCLNSYNKWKKIATTSSTSFTHSNLNTGTTYTYTVRCLDRYGNYASGYDKTGKSNMFITTPQITSLTSVYGGVQIKWGKLSGAKGYRVYRKTNNTKWTNIAETQATSYVDKTVASGVEYDYTVRCLDENGKLISYYNNGDSVKYVAAPKITKIENTATGSKVTWSKSSGAAKYRLYYLDSNNKWKNLGTTTGTSLTHDNLTTGTTYIYTVRCLDSKGNYVSGYDKNGISNRFLAPPTISSVSKADGGNLIKWAEISGVSGYRLYRKTVGASWSKLADITFGNSYVDISAQAGVVYTYTLRCLDENGKLISSYIADTKYYIDGKLANGKVYINGTKYYFNNGLFRSGFQTISGKKYYYNSSGVLQKNNIVGSENEGWYYADKNGVCCESEEIRLAAEYMMKYCKGDTLDEKMKSGFLYMAKNFPYRRSYDHPKGASDVADLAIDMFKNESGNCFRYAACFACVAKIAGYRTRVAIGTAGGNPHGWTEVLVDGEWLICDPDAQLPGYNVPDYYPYMMKKHYWNIVPTVKCELVIENGKAIWK